jgi:NADH:ubiquinone oxidoreductase subunit H
MLAFALFPFLTQHPDYVIEQYLACLSNTTNALHVGVVVPGWTTPFTALRVGSLNVPEGVQTVIRLVAAVGTLVLCLFTRRRHNAAVSVIFLLSLAILYLLLFSPRTENNTYAMLGPIIGLFLALAFQVEKRHGESFLLAVIAMGVIATHPIERLLAPHAEQIWLSPLLAICFTVYLLIKLFTYPDNSKEMHEHRSYFTDLQ